MNRWDGAGPAHGRHWGRHYAKIPNLRRALGKMRDEQGSRPYYRVLDYKVI
jgi:hypothetical protein